MDFQIYLEFFPIFFFMRDYYMVSTRPPKFIKDIQKY